MAAKEMVLRSLDCSLDYTCVLLRQKAARHSQIEIARGHQRHQGQTQHEDLVPQHPFEAPLITAKEKVEAALTDAVHKPRRAIAGFTPRGTAEYQQWASRSMTMTPETSTATLSVGKLVEHAPNQSAHEQ